MSHSIVLTSSLVVAVLATAFAVYSLLDNNNDDQFTATAQDNDTNNSLKIIGGEHGLGHYQTTGNPLDPLNFDGTANTGMDSMEYLRSFNYGRVSTLEDGTTLREFTIIAQDATLEVSPGVFMEAWTFNGTIPGPTFRATEGDLIRINFINNGSHPHSIHTHGIHRAEMDGVFELVNPGGRFVYEFYAEQFGVYPYHCHVMPLEEHIARGLYGVYIIDPKEPRPEADEMVMIMNGYDTDFDTENNFYTVNGVPYYYMHHPIEIEKDRLVRIYLVNMLEFDPINNFHLHGNLYNVYRSGTSLEPDELTDMVTMSQGERGILEFSYKYPGMYMFHAHKTEFAEKGWMGLFLVKDPDGNNNTTTSAEPQYPSSASGSDQ